MVAFDVAEIFHSSTPKESGETRTDLARLHWALGRETFSDFIAAFTQDKQPFWNEQRDAHNLIPNESNDRKNNYFH